MWISFPLMKTVAGRPYLSTARTAFRSQQRGMRAVRLVSLCVKVLTLNTGANALGASIQDENYRIA